MARDKLITIRIEGEKREAFNQLAKSQNTDTASLLYDFINLCLSGQIDISLVTDKGNRIDNRIDNNRIDKIEMTTQRLDERVGQISKKLNDWIEAFDDRLNDCDRDLSHKMISLEHRLSSLAFQLDSQKDSHPDSQQDSQGENPDMGTVAPVEAVIESVETAIGTVESATDTVESDSMGEPVTGSIGPVRGEGDSISEPCKGMNAAEAFRYATTKGVKVSEKTLSNWVSKIKHIPLTDKGDAVSEYLMLRDGRYYPID